MPRKVKRVGECGCSGFHWHLNGMAHEHEHDAGHHGPAFGKKHVTEVEPIEGPSEAIASVLLDEPVDLGLIRDLKQSIQWAEARKRDEHD